LVVTRAINTEAGSGAQLVTARPARPGKSRALYSYEKIEPSLSMRSRAMPEPRTTQVSGSSATSTGRPVSSIKRRSRSRSSAPPPVSIMPFSAMSAPSSGGACSSAFFTADTIWFSGSVSASRISLLEMVNERGMPSDRLRPLTSISLTSEPGNAEPIAFLIASAVCSPISMP